jgi:hypothetical protein
MASWSAFQCTDEGGNLMPERGKRLRDYRNAWGWTTRRVEELSRKLAAIWNDPEYIIHASTISRIERGEIRLSCVAFAKVEGMIEMYSTGPKGFTELRPKRPISLVEDPLDEPVRTRIVQGGRFAEKTSALIHAAYADRQTPELTAIKSFSGKDSFDEIHPFQDRKRYLRAVVGLKDTCLRHKLTAGTMLIVDQKWNTIPKYDFYIEDDRPMFLVDTHFGMFCCWCDSLDDGNTIKIVPHPASSLSPLPHRQLHAPLKINRDINVVGEVVFWGTESRRHQERHMRGR